MTSKTSPDHAPPTGGATSCPAICPAGTPTAPTGAPLPKPLACQRKRAHSAILAHTAQLGAAEGFPMGARVTWTDSDPTHLAVEGQPCGGHLIETKEPRLDGAGTYTFGTCAACGACFEDGVLTGHNLTVAQDRTLVSGACKRDGCPDACDNFEEHALAVLLRAARLPEGWALDMPPASASYLFLQAPGGRAFIITAQDDGGRPT